MGDRDEIKVATLVPQFLSPPPLLESTALFAGAREIVIRHDGQDYRLCITRQNKPILT